MIQLSAPALTSKTSTHLSTQQAKIDTLSSYEEKVDNGKTLWGVKESTKAAKAAFKEIKDKLVQMSARGRRCHYCEDSCADEIEDIYPKDLYPERVFDWDNYLYACGICNGTSKNNKFAIIDSQQAIIDVTRARNAAVVAPPHGAPLLINPRVEDPLEFFYLDLSQTFHFVPVDELLAPQRDALRYERAKYTIELLRLNTRPELVDSRADAYASYTSRLFEYGQLSQINPHAPELADKLESLTRLSHRAVWENMKRQQAHIPILAQLFALAPAALAV